MRRARCFVLLLLTLALVDSFGARASAQLPRQLRVRWSSPSSCTRGVEFDRELAHRLGDDTLDVEPSQIEVRIDALSSDRELVRYRLRLVLAVAEGRSERVLELDSCADVRHAAALLIATALEQRRATSEDVAAQQASEPSAWQLRLGLLTDTGTVPGVSAGPTAGVDWERAGLRLAAQAHYLLARRVRDASSMLVADIDQLAGTLGVAYLWPLGRVRAGPTLDAEFGALRARGRGEQGSHSKIAPWASALLGLAAELPTTERLTLALWLSLSLPPWRPSFSLEDEPPFYTSRAYGFRLGLGVRVLLGFKKELTSGQ